MKSGKATTRLLVFQSNDDTVDANLIALSRNERSSSIWLGFGGTTGATCQNTECGNNENEIAFSSHIYEYYDDKEGIIIIILHIWQFWNFEMLEHTRP